MAHLSPEELHRYVQNIERTKFGGFIKNPRDLDLSSIDFRAAHAVESNIASLSETARSQGYLSFDVEPDGSMRKLPIVVKYYETASDRDYFFPPMSVRVLKLFLKGALLFQVGEFGAFTKISESTYEPAKDFIEARELDSIRVVGRATPVKIFELLGKKGSMDETIRSILPLYNKALELYREGRWGEAIIHFEKVLEK